MILLINNWVSDIQKTSREKERLKLKSLGFLYYFLCNIQTLFAYKFMPCTKTKLALYSVGFKRKLKCPTALMGD